MSTKESQRLKRLFYTQQGLTCQGKVRSNPNAPRIRKTRSLVYGVGILDVSVSCRHPSVVDYWRRWTSMLGRCYSKKTTKHHQSYIGCSVAPEWFSLTAFIHWVDTQPEKNWRDLELDKDITVPGNKVYGPATCAFVTHKINSFFLPGIKKTSNLPVGVSHCGNRYEPSIPDKHGVKRSAHRRSTDTPEESQIIFLQFRCGEALKLISTTKVPGVIARLQNEYNTLNNLRNTVIAAMPRVNIEECLDIINTLNENI